MGAWGGGLYDSDYARDLRALIEGIWRAPLSDDELIAETRAPHSAGHDDLDVLDHWLVLADQLERRGLHRVDVFDRAMAIIEKGADIVALEELGSTPSVIAKRRKAAAELLERLRNPRAAKQRRPLTVPQPLLFEAGEALAWPTDQGRIRSPYIDGGFKQDGWGFGIVSDVGHVYGVLAYHAVQTLKWRRSERPTVTLAVHCPRSEHQYGTITPADVEQLGIERLGLVPQSALGPPLEFESGPRDARRAALHGPMLPQAFGFDAFDSSVWPGPKFMFQAPSGAPIDPDEPDQRPGMYDDDAEFSALAADRPATRQHYLNLIRTQAAQ
jgi:hypothetical protein